MKRTVFIFAVFFFAVVMGLCVAPSARAERLREFYRGVRASAMGNAFTAISDDDDAILYNPAGIAFSQSVKIKLGNSKLEAADARYFSEEGIKEFSGMSLNADSINKIFGKNIYLGGTTFPLISIPYFTMGYYYGTDFHLVARNPVYPQFELNYHYDKGVIAGSAYEFSGLSKKHFLRVGFSVKWLTRRGFEGVIPLDRMVRGDKNSAKEVLLGPAQGYGASLGFQYEVPLSKSTDFILASACTDIGDTKFGKGSASDPPKIRNNLSAGFALIQKFNQKFTKASSNMSFKLSAEMRHLAETYADPRVKAHVGAELKFWDFFAAGGFGDGQFSYGFGLDMFLFKISAVSYGVENQALYRMDPERRYAFNIGFELELLSKPSRTKRDNMRRKHPRSF